ncbi:deoxynucleoside triphosphate triphosphohydrolase SAMHD1, partial [Biomphalaria pfeifferi]
WTDLDLKETEAKEEVAKLECIFLQCIKGIEITNLNDKILKVIITNLDFGMKDENPIHRLRVYEKGNLHQGFKLEQDQTSLLLQSMNYNEVLVRVYTTLPNKDGGNETNIQSIKEACKKEMQEWMKIKEN